MHSQQADPIGTRVTSQLRDSGWLQQSPEDGFGAGQPQFTYEIPLRHPDGESRAELLSGDLSLSELLELPFVHAGYPVPAFLGRWADPRVAGNLGVTQGVRACT